MLSKLRPLINMYEEHDLLSKILTRRTVPAPSFSAVVISRVQLISSLGSRGMRGFKGARLAF